MVDGPYKFNTRCEVSIPDAVTGEPCKSNLFVEIAEDHTRSVMLTADKFIMVKSEPAFVNYDGRLFLDVKYINALIAAGRALCDNVKTVGTHNRIDTEHIDKLRQALDRL